MPTDPMMRRPSLLPMLFAIACLGAGCGSFRKTPVAERAPRAPRDTVPKAEREVRALVDAARARCPGRLKRSLGLDLEHDPRLAEVRFELRSSREAASLDLPSSSPGGFHRVALDQRVDHVVTVFLEPARARPERVEAFVCHEMVHAMMAIGLGERTSEIPRWLHEGLAVYGSGQLGDKLATLVAARGPSPPGFPDGLDHHETGVEDLVEGALAVSYIAHYRGADAVRELTRRLLEGATADEAVLAVTGFGPECFRERVREFIEVRLRTMRRR